MADKQAHSAGKDLLDYLAIDLGYTAQLLSEFILQESFKVGFKRVVLGLSGGIDSALACLLAAKALGAEQVHAIMMPYKTSSPDSLDDARKVIEVAGARCQTIDISPMVDSYFAQQPEASALRRGNMMARVRMSVLFDQSMAHNALVLGTSNKTELLLGYGTQYGDMASALNPLGDLYKTQVFALSDLLGVPESVCTKPPSADLWSGQTDEQELGFSYAEVDMLLHQLVDLRRSVAELVRMGFAPAFIDKISKIIRQTHYKRRLPVIAKVSGRTIDRDFRYARDWGV